MKLPSQLRIRILSWLSVAVLSVASLFTLLYVLPRQGLAQLPSDTTQVTGTGQAEFIQDSIETLACAYTVSAEDSDPVTGSVDCDMDAEAMALGIPFQSLSGDVTSISLLSDEKARLSGTATLTLPDGSELPDVVYVLRVTAGGPDEGKLTIRLIGLFDGEPGDAKLGNGDYDQWTQTVIEGSIDIGVAPSPSPSPSVTGSPSPTPSGSPSPSPTPSPSSTLPGTPSPTPTTSSSPLPLPTPGGGTPPPFQDAPAPPTGAMSTARLMAVLSQLSPDGNPPLSDILQVVGPFPVAGLTWWTNDWHAYRCCPYPHLHQGLDMFADTGTPVVAAASGRVSQRVIDPAISGLAVEITDANDTQYFYAHLSRFAPGLHVGQQVRVGEILGYVGNTGNAVQTSPHLHFEIQPNGVPEPPKPIVDGWLALAQKFADALVATRTDAILSPATLDRWLARARSLEARLITLESSDESILEARGTQLAATDNDPAPSAGAMVAVASFLLLALLVAPACALGRRAASRSGPPGG